MEDREIVELYWERDPEAIRETDSKYGDCCRMISKNIPGSVENAEECVCHPQPHPEQIEKISFRKGL